LELQEQLVRQIDISILSFYKNWKKIAAEPGDHASCFPKRQIDSSILDFQEVEKLCPVRKWQKLLERFRFLFAHWTSALRRLGGDRCSPGHHNIRRLVTKTRAKAACRKSIAGS
jgi:hypothetical protein